MAMPDTAPAGRLCADSRESGTMTMGFITSTGIAAGGVLLLLLAGIAPTAPAHAGDTGQAHCARIRDVDLPFDVARDDGTLRFSRRATRIVVTADAVEHDGHRWEVVDAARYHADLQRFLDTSTAVAAQARPLTKLLRGPTPELARAALDACEAVLALAESNRRIEAAAPGFRSPVQIRLSPLPATP
jgi:hypothetical protein